MLLKEHNYVEINDVSELTPKVLLKLVDAHKMNQLPRLKKLYEYYRGNNTEILKQRKVTDKPDSRITNSFAKIITDEITNVFISEPIKYSSDNQMALLELDIVNQLNDEAFHNYQVAKDASIYSIGAEILYTDANAEIRFARIDPTQLIPVYSIGITNELIACIRYYTIESLDDSIEDKHMIEVYDNDTIKIYENVGGALRLNEETPHFFNKCPINIFNSNYEETGDAESVITLIDAYDRMLSETDNIFRYFSDAYLVMTGVDQIEPEDVSSMKEQRIILMPEGGNASFLAKQTDATSLADQFERLRKNIFKFSYAVDIDEQQFGNDVSGVALKYRLQLLEGVCSARERIFTQAIIRRIEMIFNILGVKGKHYNANEIEITFVRNVPANESELIANAQALTGIVSKQTILDMLPNVDALDELKRLEDEQAGLNKALDPYANVEFGIQDDEEELPAME